MNDNDFRLLHEKHDNEKAMNYYEDDNLCLRCEEQEAEPDEDWCEHCIELAIERNRDKFQAEETY
jgi:hypothetical protein